MSTKDYDEAAAEADANIEIKREQVIAMRQELVTDSFYQGVPALTNTYALTKLYGSEGGEYLVNRRRKRKWYEVDQTIGSGAGELAFSSNPNTS